MNTYPIPEHVALGLAEAARNTLKLAAEIKRAAPEGYFPKRWIIDAESQARAAIARYEGLL